MSTTVFRSPEGHEYTSFCLPVTLRKWGMFWLGKLNKRYEYVVITKVGPGMSSGKPLLVGRLPSMEHVHFDQVTGLSVSPVGYRIEAGLLQKILTAMSRPDGKIDQDADWGELGDIDMEARF